MKKAFPLILLILLALTALCLGDLSTSPNEVWRALTNRLPADSLSAFIILQVRLPQMLTAILCGSSLAAAGLVMQTVFSNPLADPSLLGVNAGAGLGAAVAMLFWGGTLTTGAFTLGGYVLTVAASCAGAIGIVLLLMSLSALFRSNLHLLVAGVMISFVASAVISILSFFASQEGLQSYMVWGMGDFSSVTLERLPLFAALLLAGLVLLFLQAKPLNALLLGTDYAQNLGIRPKRARTLLLFTAGILCAVVTALCGPIAFIGLAAPQVARFVHQTANHRTLLPMSILWGADMALLALVLGHAAPGGLTLPVNAITPLMGVPVVMLLLIKRN